MQERPSRCSIIPSIRTRLMHRRAVAAGEVLVVEGASRSVSMMSSLDARCVASTSGADHPGEPLPGEGPAGACAAEAMSQLLHGRAINVGGAA